MDIRKLQRAIVDGLEDVKAQHIVVFNTEAMSPLFERVIIASGTSNRQTKALASSVRDAVKAGGMQVLRSEGEENGEWIIVDCGAAVVHVMQPSIRDYYRLEEIWGGKPVNVKIGGPAKATEDAKPAKKAAAKTAPAKSSRTEAAPVKKAPATKAAAGKPPARKASGRAAPAAKKAAPARRAPAPKAPAAKKAAPRKTPRA